MLRKSSILLVPHTRSYSTANPINAPSPSRNSPHCPSGRRRRQQQLFHTSRRLQAVVPTGYSSNTHNSNLRWPEVTSAKAIPNPYQIFNQRKGAPYSKSRFYELVKLYHPDRHCRAGPGDLPHAIKLERYRLVVAANDILSCPMKRGAYDAYGAGWNGVPPVTQNGSPGGGWDWESGHRAWNNPKGPKNNATWEDWEAWRNPEQPQRPVFLSNLTFSCFLVFLASLGIMGQVVVADGHSQRFVDHQEKLHAEASKELMKRRRETRLSAGNPDDRISKFLRLRNEGLLGTDMEHKMFMRQSGITDEEEKKIDEIGATKHASIGSPV